MKGAILHTSIAEIYTDYLTSLKPEKVRDPLRLFVTDVGRCPRSAAYRMLEAKQDYKSKEQQMADLIMWEQAEHVEETLYKAFYKEYTYGNTGRMPWYQEPVEVERENWGGRLDIMANYDGMRIIEVKTLIEPAMKKDLPIKNHAYQASIYHKYCRYIYNLGSVPLLVYFNRGGNTEPTKECELFNWAEYVATAEVLMDELDSVRDELPQLPAKREKELKVFDRGLSLKSVRHHDCAYCPYKGVCEPLSGSETWAKRKTTSHPWEFTKKADLDKCLEYAEGLTSASISQEEE